MKRNILITLILCTSISFVGCSSNNSESDNTQDNVQIESTNEVDETTDKQELNDKMIKEFETLLPKVQNAYAESNIEVEDSYNKRDKIYNKTSLIRYRGEVSEKYKEITHSKFTLSFDDEGLAYAIDWTTYINMDEDIIQSEGFKIEDTFLNKMTELMIDNSEHNSQINETINNYYKNNGDGRFEFEYGNISGSVGMEGDELRYTIQVWE